MVLLGLISGRMKKLERGKRTQTLFSSRFPRGFHGV
jgi:hypothetical protein